MSTELPRTYVPFKDWKEKSKQIEYTEPTPLLNKDGTLNARGWARHNVFEYDRKLVKRERLISCKEWDYYTVTDGQKQLLVSFANVGIGGFMGLRLIDLHTGEVHADGSVIFVGANKFLPLNRIDAPGRFTGKQGTTVLMVTHDHNLVRDFNHRVIMLDSGRIIADNVGGEI